MSISVMIVDDEENARLNIGAFLSEKGFELVLCDTLSKAREALQRGEADIVLLDVDLPDGYGPSLLFDIAQLPFQPLVIIITAFGDIDMAVDAMKKGAKDFLTKPIDFDRLEESIQRLVEMVKLRRELMHYRQLQKNHLKFVVGASDKFNQSLQEAKRAARVSVSVLITGETGSGKEVIAKYIHDEGSRAGKAFVALNCGAIQATVLESELFGYEPGAFTGAEKRKIGLMELADEGILFLDEIASMPLDIQVKLLRAIEDKAFYRVGGTKLIKVDVQLLAASNRDLQKMVDEGEFRQDLYYRLKVVDVNVPSLRERSEDIAELTGFFISKFNSQMGMNIQDISPLALNALISYQWPGNIRELSNAIERAMLFCDDAIIELSHLPSNISQKMKLLPPCL